MISKLTDHFEDFIVQRMKSVETRLNADVYYQSEHSVLNDRINQLANTLNPEQKKLLDCISYEYNAFFPAQQQRAAYRLGLLDGLTIMATL